MLLYFGEPPSRLARVGVWWDAAKVQVSIKYGLGNGGHILGLVVSTDEAKTTHAKHKKRLHAHDCVRGQMAVYQPGAPTISKVFGRVERLNQTGEAVLTGSPPSSETISIRRGNPPAVSFLER